MLIKTAYPTSKDVLRELRHILKHDPAFYRSHDVEKLTMHPHVIGSFRDLWLLILVILVILALLYLLQRMNPYIQGNSSHDSAKTRPEKRENSRLLNSYLVLYHQAIAQSQSNRYREATISLHKATVDYLLEKTLVVAVNKKYTNNDLKKKLQDNMLYQPFCAISGLAEIAGFSTVEIRQGEFTEVLNAFEQSFLSLMQREV